MFTTYLQNSSFISHNVRLANVYGVQSHPIWTKFSFLTPYFTLCDPLSIHVLIFVLRAAMASGKNGDTIFHLKN